MRMKEKRAHSKVMRLKVRSKRKCYGQSLVDQALSASAEKLKSRTMSGGAITGA